MKRIFKPGNLLSVLLILLFTMPLIECQSKEKLPPYNNPTGDEFPIMAWYSFRPAELVNKKNFLIMREAGFNITQTLTNQNIVDLTLEAVKGTGVKVMVNCAQTRNPETIPAALKKYRNNPDVAGYFINDEPSASKFEKLHIISESLRENDPDRIVFVNFFPIINPKRLEARNYETYIKDGVTKIGLPLFSYDNYPLTLNKNGKIKISDTFYENLEIALKISKSLNRPFWAFCMSSQHYDFAYPSEACLSFEAFSALAYGAQGLSYYTYVKKDDINPQYLNAPVNPDGSTTDIWESAKKINTKIHALEKIFLGCKVIEVRHTGKIPQKTKSLKKLPKPFKSIQTEEAGVLVSHLQNNGNDYLIIVNHEVERFQKINLETSGSIYRLSAENGEEKIFNGGSLNLEPGGFAIFKW